MRDHKGREFNITIPVIGRPLLDHEHDEYKARFDLAEDLPNDPPRASGLCECEQCGRIYYDHPHHDPFYFLTVICSDFVVKL